MQSISLTLEWIMGCRRKARTKITSKQATVVLWVRSGGGRGSETCWGRESPIGVGMIVEGA